MKYPTDREIEVAVETKMRISHTIDDLMSEMVQHPIYRGKLIAYPRFSRSSRLMIVHNCPNFEEVSSEITHNNQRYETPSYHTCFCKTPLTSPPLPRQVSILRKMLSNEVRVINPSLIMVIGESAFRNILGTTANAFDCVGKIFKFNEVDLICMLEVTGGIK